MGFKFSDPSTPFGGGGPFPRIDSAPISANNEPIFTILVSFYVFQMMPSPSMKHYKSPEVAITDFRLRSTSDIKVKVIIMVAINLVI